MKVKIWNTILIAGMAVLPVGAQAQSATPNDRAYCARLAEIYVHYIGHDNASDHRIIRAGSNDAQVAVTKCRKGDTAWAIPVLEQQLVVNKFTLPTRD
jgi:hypothetical protein